MTLAERGRWFRAFARALSAGVAVLLLARLAASAPKPKLQGIAETELGYLDSVQSAPDGTPGTIASRGVTWVLSPGLVLAIQSPRTLQRVGYRYQHDFLFGESVSSSSTSRLDYLGFFDVSPSVGLVLDGAVVEGNQYSSITFAPPGSEFLGAVPIGSTAFLQGSAGETLSYEFALGWRAWQGATIVAETPILGSTGPSTLSPGGRLGIERSFELDALGLEARSTYTVIEDGVRADGSPAELQRQLVNVGVGLWRRDWGRDFASRVEAGVLRLDRLNAGTGFWAPTGLASLAYVTPFGDAELSYSHSVTTNPVLGQTLLADAVRLRGGLPLTNDGKLLLAATAGYQTGEVVDDDLGLDTRVRAILADVALGYRVTKLLVVGARYQHVDQRSDVSLPGLPLTFVQNAVLVGASLKFPADADMPRSYRAPRRVDASDEIRDTSLPPRDDGQRDMD